MDGKNRPGPRICATIQEELCVRDGLLRLETAEKILRRHGADSPDGKIVDLGVRRVQRSIALIREIYAL